MKREQLGYRGMLPENSEDPEERAARLQKNATREQ